MIDKRRPYFEQGGVTIYHGACVDVLAEMAPRSVGLFILDPPYTEGTHKGALTNKGAKTKPTQLIDFESISNEGIHLAFTAIGRVASRWVVGTVAYQHVAHLEESPPNGLRFVRCGVWTKVAPMPQLTGDRPATGWEAVAILHASDGERMRWNGGGKVAVWHRQSTGGGYPTQKPEPLIMDLLADFGEPGDLVCDPFMGSGTTLLCAWKRGHRAIGCDIREKACEIAAKRIEAAMRQGRMDFTPAPKRSDQSTLAFE